MGSTALDVGSGNGRVASEILRSRPDLSIQGLDTLVWPEQQIATTQFDGKNIPFEDNSFDFCIASDVLHHCEHPEELLAEMVRVASKGVVLKDHIAESRFQELLLGLMDWVGNRGHGVNLAYSYWPWSQWLVAFEKVGLDVIRVKHNLSLYPFPLTWILDRKLHFACLLYLSNSR